MSVPYNQDIYAYVVMRSQAPSRPVPVLVSWIKVTTQLPSLLVHCMPQGRPRVRIVGASGR